MFHDSAACYPYEHLGSSAHLCIRNARPIFFNNANYFQAFQNAQQQKKRLLHDSILCNFDAD